MTNRNARSFDRIRVPKAADITDWTAVRADIESEVGHVNQACTALIASGSLTFVVAPILHAVKVLPTASYVLVAAFAGAGVYLALHAALIRTGPRTLGATGPDEDKDSLRRFRRKERVAFYATWPVGISLAALFVVVLVGCY